MAVKENGETVFYGWEPMWGHYNLVDAALSRGAKYLSDDGNIRRGNRLLTRLWPEFLQVCRLRNKRPRSSG